MSPMCGVHWDNTWGSLHLCNEISEIVFLTPLFDQNDYLGEISVMTIVNN